MEKNQIQQYLENEELKESIEKADKRFEFKSFTARFKGLKKFAKFISVALPAISIATGSVWLAGLLEQFIWMFLSWPLGVGLVMAIEWAKANAITNATELGYVKSWQLAIFTGGFALLLQAGSMFGSLEGVKEIHSKTDKRVEAFGITAKAQQDSLLSVWNAKIDTAKSEAEAFKDDNMIRDVGGKDVLRSGATKVYARMIAGTKDLEADRDDALEELKALQKKDVGKVVEESGFRADIVVAITLIIEALIFLANWFIVHYDYETKRLKYLLTRTDTKLDEYKSFAEVYAMYTLMPKSMQLPHASPIPKGIGFQHGKSGGQQNPHEASHAQALAQAHSQGLDPSKIQEMARNFQEMFAHGQGHNQAYSPSDEASMGVLERAISMGLLQELKAIKADGKKPAYQVLTAKYNISIPQLTQLMELHKIKF